MADVKSEPMVLMEKADGAKVQRPDQTKTGSAVAEITARTSDCPPSID